MDEGVIYGLYFAAILFNYVMKLKIERGGHGVQRSNVREGVVSGLTIYLIHQVLTLPGIAMYVRVIDTVLGGLSLAAGGAFFIKGRLRPDPES